MAEAAKTRVKVPETAKAGEVVALKALISHRMESGRRRDAAGAVIPRGTINRFTCTFNGVEVVDVDLGVSVSANPFLSFEARVFASGTFRFTWYDDDGSVYEHDETIVVT
jgi:Sulphur oxidation protein SoxZ.